jgi:hypothetical protein
MSLTNILYHKFSDPYGANYIINIYDAEGGDFLHAFATKNGSIEHTVEGDPKDPFKRILTSTLTFEMMLNHPQYEANQKDDIIQFYNDFVESQEGRFYVALSEDNLGPVLFVGKLIADLSNLKLSHHQFVKLTAHCGIKQLANEELRPENYADTTLIHTNPYTFIDFFRQILQKNDVAKQFYEIPPLPLPVLFSVNMQWTESNLPIENELDKTYMRNHYYKEVSRFYRKYESALTVLTDILNGFNMRMYYSRGCWHIEQLSSQDKLYPTRITYNYAANQLQQISTKVQRNVNGEDIKALLNPELTYIAPLKAVALKQNKQFYNILAGVNINYKPSGDDQRGPHNLGYQIGLGSFLVHDLYFDFDLSGTIDGDRFIVIEMEIKLGNYYLKNYYYDSQGNPTTPSIDWHILVNTPIQYSPFNKFDVLDYEWVNTQSTIKIAIFKNAADTWGAGPLLASFKNFNIIGVSPEIIEDGEFFLTINSVKVYNIASQEMADDTAKITQTTLLKKSRIIAAPNGITGLVEVPEDTIIYKIADTRNTLIYETSIKFFDSVSTNYLQSLFVKPSSEFLLSVEWTDADLGLTLPLQQLTLASMISMRSKYGKVIKASLINTEGEIMYFLDRYNWGNKLHIPMTWSHSVDQGIYQVDLWEVFKDFPGVNITEITGDTETEPEFPTVVLDPESPPRLGLEYYEEWLNVSQNFVELSAYNTDLINVDEYTVRSKAHLFINGVKNRYVLPATNPLPQRSWTFDSETNNKILFFKGSTQVGHIEFIKYY